MKLQKINKYSQKITSGILSILLAGSILTVCSNAEALNNEEPVYEETIENREGNANDIIDEIDKEEVVDKTKRDHNYYLNFYKISKKQKEARLERLEIKYPNAIHRTSYIRTLVVKDNNDIYKLMPVIEIFNELDKTIEFYDLFTEEKLFDYDLNYYRSSSNRGCLDTGEITGFDFTRINNAIPYFKDKKIVKYGVCFYLTTFFEEYTKELFAKDNIYYSFSTMEIISYLYDIPFNSDNCIFTTYQLADNYVKNVPLENQVTSEELGLTINYRDEDKYFDFWKINEEKLEQNLSKIDGEVTDFVFPGDSVQTLVLEDSNHEYKIINVTILIDNNEVLFKDLYTGMDLFKAPLNGDFYYNYVDENNHRYEGVDFSNMYEVIPYFEDKEIIKLDNSFETVSAVTDYIEYFREKDKINYKYPERSYYAYMYPMEEFNTNEVGYTKEEYAKNYLVTVPEDMQVTTKDLKMGLEIDNEKVKTLEK